jgi:hypothetical protein
MYCSFASIGHADNIIIIIIINFVQAMTTYNVVRGMAQHIHKRPGRLYARERTQYPFIGKLYGSYRRSRLFGEEYNFHPLQGFEPKIVWPQAQLLYKLHYPGLLLLLLLLLVVVVVVVVVIIVVFVVPVLVLVVVVEG